MKKTILTFASALLLVGATANAKSENHQVNQAMTNVVAKVEVSAFCKAIMQGDIDTVKRLIELGEDVNKKSLGMTPAIFAARYNKAEILELLIANGANLRLKSDKGYTAKKYAQLSKATEALAVIEAAMGS
ncbi:ankyrin repeat domain-containing protein [Ulvibacterium sp.]|uniref:ankyrin repeat domain-containing protein n=1 Tax=Ulvibacterium sp. TaxID=2665914 RepID=UPI00261DCAE6|nr:ankyrin repeat domain-containing protein [Ulvibacterium sp.]